MVYINTTGKHNEVWLDKPYATITVECPDCPSTEDAYNSGWTDGSEDGYHKGYQSGTTDGYDDGWGPGYDSGYTDGLEACSGSSCNLQDSKTVRLHNYEWTYYPGDHGHYGEYQLRHNPEIVSADTGYDGMKEIVLMGYIDASSAFTDGFNSGYSVGQETCSGVTPDLERKSIDLTSFFKYWPESQTYSISGSAVPYCVFPNSGYAGLERVCIYTNIDASEAIADGFQSGYTSGYSSGYTDGLNACSGGNEDLIANLQGQYYLIPYGTEWLRDYVFYYTCFSSITIPDTVVAIGSYAFAYNECLTSITIPDSVQSVGKNAFYRCVNLQTAILGSGLTKLESYTFSNCTSLTGITIPSGISQIEKFSFANCSDLTEMTFEGLNPPTINTENSLGSKDYTFPIYVPCESVEAYKTAFGQYYEPRIMCNSGTSGVSMLDFTYVTTGDNQTINLFMGEMQNDNQYFYAFYSAITYMEIDGVPTLKDPNDIQRSTPEIPGENSYRLYTHTFASAGTHTVRFMMSRSFSASTQTGTKYPAFELTDLIFCSNSQDKCPVINANIGAGYEVLKTGVFQGNKTLTAATIPASVTGITWVTFENSTIKQLTCYGTTPPTLGSNVFAGVTTLEHIYVPAEAVEDYKAATNWSNYASIISAIQ